MEYSADDVDSAFRCAGAKPGLEIWCVENLRLVPVPKSSHGKFFSGSAYLVLHTFLLKNGSPQHEIHYWLGSETTEVDAIFASDKALELDAALGSYAVQYREVQGQETEKFLSYFKPCIIPIEGTFSSGQANLDGNTYRVSLLTCKGDRVVHVKEVPFARSSLNHNDVFILDTASKIFLFSGCNSSIQERAKALEVVEYVKETKHNGKCDIATIEDGKFVADPDVGEFWSLFGGYAPIPRDLPSSLQGQPESSAAKLFWITTQGKFSQTAAGELTKGMLSSDKCYMLDCKIDLFVWLGRNALITERKTSIKAAEEFIRSEGRSNDTQLIVLTEGSETASFQSYFGDWPEKKEINLYEEGRGKVAAIFKQQGYDVKELPDEDEEDVFVDLSGETKVWQVDGDATNIIPVAEPTIFYSGNCYILQYRYPTKGREENLFYAWLGKSSVTEDKVQAISHMNAFVNSTKGDPVMARIVEGEEPQQFFSVLKTLVIFKGGNSAVYKTSIEEKGIADETYDESKSALFRVQGTSPFNMQAVQVDQVPGSLNSSYCYILKTENSTYTWIGNLSSERDHDLLDRMLMLINPTWQAVLVREGNEPDLFWTALGGKAEYPREKKIKEYTEDPHLFLIASSKGDLKVKEIFNFSQDDFTTEDVLILNCHSEIYIWVGRHSSIDSKQQALDLGLEFLEKAASVGKLHSEIPIYVITEGCEPPFFTRFFEWDSSKANMLGNSFERKLAMLKGKTQKLEAPSRSSWKAYSKESISDGLKSHSNGIGRVRKSLSPVSRVSGSSLRSSDIRRLSSPPSFTTRHFTGSPDIHSRKGVRENVPSPTPGKTGQQLDQYEISLSLPNYPYEQLTVQSNNPAPEIDITKREAYLSEEEFQERFGVPKKCFYQLPKWKRNKLKMSLNLF